MKTRLTKLKLVALLCGALGTTAVVGQTTYVWTNSTGGVSANLAGTTNWNPNGLPSAAIPDTMQFDGQSVGPVLAISTSGMAGGFQNLGIQVHLTANQTQPVNFYTTVSGASAGMRLDDITIDSGAGSFSIGHASTTNAIDILLGGTAGEVHNFLNNSANPAILWPNFRIRYGGGGTHTIVFDGTGNWYVTNFLISANNSPTVVTKQGPGTMVWTGGQGPFNGNNSQIGSPLTITEGTLIVKSSDLLTATTLGPRTIANEGSLIYDGGGAGTLSGAISGAGTLRINSGSVTLSSGGSTFSGNITLGGGTLFAGGAETEGASGPLGLGGTISFIGGTLGFSAANTYDYSPRFSTAAGQAYSFDSGGQNVVLTNALTSSGGTLTKVGSGTVTLTGANTFSGATTVNAGKLVIEGASASTGITVASSAALGVKAGATVAPTTLTVGANAALEFNSVSSTANPLIAAGTVSASGAILINVNSGTFVVGQSYPLFSWSSGSAPAVTLGTVTGAGGTLSTNGSQIQLNVTSLAYVWSGSGSGLWDTTTANNWILNAAPTLWVNGNIALFDETAVGETNVVLNAPITQAGVTVNSSAKTYSITSSGANLIAGTGGLTKNGNSTLTLAGGVNTYSGATTIGGGTVSVGTLANGGAPSDIGAASSSAGSLVLNGGTLLYTGAAQSSDRLLTLGTAGGAISASGTGALTLNNAGAAGLAGSGARGFTLTGTNVDDNTFAASLADSGGATALTKSGDGKWIVSGNNAISGAVTISGGTLQVGAGGASGSVGSGNILANGALIFNRTGSVTNGIISGSGSVTVSGGGTVVLPGNNSYSGGTTISNNSTLQVGNGGPTGSLFIGGPIVNDGTLIFDTTGGFSYTANGLISGTGNVIMRGVGGRVRAIGANSYTGWTQIDPGAIFQPSEGNTGAFTSSVVTNNGILMFVRQDTATFSYSGNIVGTGAVRMGGNNNNSGDITLLGTNTYTGGTFIGSGGIVLGDGVNAGAGSIVGDVTFVPNFDTPDNNFRTLVFNRAEDVTFPGLISYSTNLPFGNRGVVVQGGINTTLTLTANNDYPGGTLITNGATLQVGNGGTSGAIGTGPVTDDGTLIFNRADNIAFGAVISGGGAVVKAGAGTLTLTATNTYFGNLTVSNGTLIVNGQEFPAQATVYGTLGGTGLVAGPVIMETGSTLAPGAAAGAVGTLTINSDLLLGGSVAVDVNRSLVQSNDLVVVSGTISKTGAGTLTVANVGPTAIAAGDKFTLFSQPVTGGETLTVSGAGATWQNNLATDGSITALTGGTAPVNQNPPVVQVSVSAGTLSLAWPTNLGWTLQTNGVALTAANQWFTYPGSASVTNVNISINPANTNVFFRMVYP